MGSKCCKCNQAADKIYSDVYLGAEGQHQFHSQDCSQYSYKAVTDPNKSKAKVVVEPLRPSRIKMGGNQFPEFLKELTDLAVKVGTKVRLLVEVRSSSLLKVNWYQNETKITNSEGLNILNEGNLYCIEVNPILVDSEGRWTCVAENLSGRSSCSCQLRVVVPRSYKTPEFVQGLRAVLTEAGTVSLECKVVGIPAPTLKWFKDNKEIKAGDIFALTASASDPTSLGTYTCEASNCMGRAISSSKVHIQNKNIPVIIQELVDHKARVGEIHTLAVTLIPPYPTRVEWYNKGELVANSDTKFQSLSKEDGIASICLSPLTLDDDGDWRVCLINDEGLSSSSSCQLSIVIPKNYRKPRFLENLKAVLTEEGLVSFECKVVGFPTPQLYWYKDGHELRPGDVYQLSGTNSLGVYSCVAKNCMGLSESNAELTLEDIQHQLSEEDKKQLLNKTIHPPKFSKGLKSIEGKINEKLRLSVESTEQITTTWYRENDIILESDKYKISSEGFGCYNLDIDRLELIDEAEWKCLGINEYGHSMTSCRVTVIVPAHYRKPKFLEPLRAVLSNEGTVNLECKVIGVPQPQLKWYKDGVELKAGDIHKIISGEGGSCCCLGTYTCSAFNCMGTVSSSAALLGFEEKLLEKKPEEPKFDFEPLSTIAEERSSQMLSIYETPSDKSISFSIDGKEHSVSLYETPDLTENDAKQIFEMFANQCSENVSEQNLITLPSLRFMRETSTSGRILMEAVVIDVTSFNTFGYAKSDQTENDVDDLSEELENIKRPLLIQENEELFDLASLTEEGPFDIAQIRDSSLVTPIVQEDVPYYQEENILLSPQSKQDLFDDSKKLEDSPSSLAESYQLFPLERQHVHDFELAESLESDRMTHFQKMASNLIENHSLDVQENSHLSQVGELSTFGDTSSTNVYVGFIPNQAYQVDNGGHFEHFDSFNINEEEESSVEADMTVQQRQAQIIQLQQHLSNLGGAFFKDDAEYGTRADMVASEQFPVIPSLVYVETGVETLSEIESMKTYGTELEVENEFLQSSSTSVANAHIINLPLEPNASPPEELNTKSTMDGYAPEPSPLASSSETCFSEFASPEVRSFDNGPEAQPESDSVRETVIEGPDSELDETGPETQFQYFLSEDLNLQTAILRTNEPEIEMDRLQSTLIDIETVAACSLQQRRHSQLADGSEMNFEEAVLKDVIAQINRLATEGVRYGRTSFSESPIAEELKKEEQRSAICHIMEIANEALRDNIPTFSDSLPQATWEENPFQFLLNAIHEISGLASNIAGVTESEINKDQPTDIISRSDSTLLDVTKPEEDESFKSKVMREVLAEITSIAEEITRPLAVLSDAATTATTALAVTSEMKTAIAKIATLAEVAMNTIPTESAEASHEPETELQCAVRQIAELAVENIIKYESVTKGEDNQQQAEVLQDVAIQIQGLAGDALKSKLEKDSQEEIKIPKNVNVTPVEVLEIPHEFVQQIIDWKDTIRNIVTTGSSLLTNLERKEGKSVIANDASEFLKIFSDISATASKNQSHLDEISESTNLKVGSALAKIEKIANNVKKLIETNTLQNEEQATEMRKSMLKIIKIADSLLPHEQPKADKVFDISEIDAKQLDVSEQSPSEAKISIETETAEPEDSPESLEMKDLKTRQIGISTMMNRLQEVVGIVTEVIDVNYAAGNINEKSIHEMLVQVSEVCNVSTENNEFEASVTQSTAKVEKVKEVLLEICKVAAETNLKIRSPSGEVQTLKETENFLQAALHEMVVLVADLVDDNRPQLEILNAENNGQIHFEEIVLPKISSVAIKIRKLCLEPEILEPEFQRESQQIKIALCLISNVAKQAVTKTELGVGTIEVEEKLGEIKAALVKISNTALEAVEHANLKIAGSGYTNQKTMKQPEMLRTALSQVVVAAVNILDQLKSEESKKGQNLKLLENVNETLTQIINLGSEACLPNKKTKLTQSETTRRQGIENGIKVISNLASEYINKLNLETDENGIVSKLEEIANTGNAVLRANRIIADELGIESKRMHDIILHDALSTILKTSAGAIKNFQPESHKLELTELSPDVALLKALARAACLVDEIVDEKCIVQVQPSIVDEVESSILEHDEPSISGTMVQDLGHIEQVTAELGQIGSESMTLSEEHAIIPSNAAELLEKAIVRIANIIGTADVEKSEEKKTKMQKFPEDETQFKTWLDSAATQISSLASEIVESLQVSKVEPVTAKIVEDFLRSTITSINDVVTQPMEFGEATALSGSTHEPVAQADAVAKIAEGIVAGISHTIPLVIETKNQALENALQLLTDITTNASQLAARAVEVEAPETEMTGVSKTEEKVKKAKKSVPIDHLENTGAQQTFTILEEVIETDITENSLKATAVKSLSSLLIALPILETEIITVEPEPVENSQSREQRNKLKQYASELDNIPEDSETLLEHTKCDEIVGVLDKSDKGDERGPTFETPNLPKAAEPEYVPVSMGSQVNLEEQSRKRKANRVKKVGMPEPETDFVEAEYLCEQTSVEMFDDKVGESTAGVSGEPTLFAESVACTEPVVQTIIENIEIVKIVVPEREAPVPQHAVCHEEPAMQIIKGEPSTQVFPGTDIIDNFPTDRLQDSRLNLDLETMSKIIPSEHQVSLEQSQSTSLSENKNSGSFAEAEQVLNDKKCSLEKNESDSGEIELNTPTSTNNTSKVAIQINEEAAHDGGLRSSRDNEIQSTAFAESVADMVWLVPESFTDQVEYQPVYEFIDNEDVENIISRSSEQMKKIEDATSKLEKLAGAAGFVHLDKNPAPDKNSTKNAVEVNVELDSGLPMKAYNETQLEVDTGVTPSPHVTTDLGSIAQGVKDEFSIADETARPVTENADDLSCNINGKPLDTKPKDSLHDTSRTCQLSTESGTGGMEDDTGPVTKETSKKNASDIDHTRTEADGTDNKRECLKESKEKVGVEENKIEGSKFTQKHTGLESLGTAATPATDGMKDKAKRKANTKEENKKVPTKNIKQAANSQQSGDEEILEKAGCEMEMAPEETVDLAKDYTEPSDLNIGNDSAAKLKWDNVRVTKNGKLPVEINEALATKNGIHIGDVPKQEKECNSTVMTHKDTDGSNTIRELGRKPDKSANTFEEPENAPAGSYETGSENVANNKRQLEVVVLSREPDTKIRPGAVDAMEGFENQNWGEKLEKQTDADKADVTRTENEGGVGEILLNGAEGIDAARVNIPDTPKAQMEGLGERKAHSDSEAARVIKEVDVEKATDKIATKVLEDKNCGMTVEDVPVPEEASGTPGTNKTVDIPENMKTDKQAKVGEELGNIVSKSDEKQHGPGKEVMDNLDSEKFQTSDSTEKSSKPGHKNGAEGVIHAEGDGGTITKNRVRETAEAEMSADTRLSNTALIQGHDDGISGKHDDSVTQYLETTLAQMSPTADEKSSKTKKDDLIKTSQMKSMAEEKIHEAGILSEDKGNEKKSYNGTHVGPMDDKTAESTKSVTDVFDKSGEREVVSTSLSDRKSNQEGKKKSKGFLDTEEKASCAKAKQSDSAGGELDAKEGNINVDCKSKEKEADAEKIRIPDKEVCAEKAGLNQNKLFQDTVAEVTENVSDCRLWQADAEKSTKNAPRIEEGVFQEDAADIRTKRRGADQQRKTKVHKKVENGDGGSITAEKEAFAPNTDTTLKEAYSTEADESHKHKAGTEAESKANSSHQKGDEKHFSPSMIEVVNEVGNISTESFTKAEDGSMGGQDEEVRQPKDEAQKSSKSVPKMSNVEPFDMKPSINASTMMLVGSDAQKDILKQESVPKTGEELHVQPVLVHSGASSKTVENTSTSNKFPATHIVAETTHADSKSEPKILSKSEKLDNGVTPQNQIISDTRKSYIGTRTSEEQFSEIPAEAMKSKSTIKLDENEVGKEHTEKIDHQNESLKQLPSNKYSEISSKYDRNSHEASGLRQHARGYPDTLGDLKNMRYPHPIVDDAFKSKQSEESYSERGTPRSPRISTPKVDKRDSQHFELGLSEVANGSSAKAHGIDKWKYTNSRIPAPTISTHIEQQQDYPSNLTSDWQHPSGSNQAVPKHEPVEWKTFNYPKQRRSPYDPRINFEPLDSSLFQHSEWSPLPRPDYTRHDNRGTHFREGTDSKVRHNFGYVGTDKKPGEFSAEWAQEKSQWEATEELKLRSRREALGKTMESIHEMKLESQRILDEKKAKREALIEQFSKRMLGIEASKPPPEAIPGMPSVLKPGSQGYAAFTDEISSSTRNSAKRPRFSLKLQDRAVTKGSVVKLTCTVLGQPLPQLQFYKNGFPIGPDGSKIIITDNSGVASLNILRATKEDMAEYTCFARNMHGRAATSCILTVVGDEEKKPKPAKFTRAITETQFRDVDEMLLECVVSGNPTPRVQWLRDGQVIIAFGSHGTGRYISAMTMDGKCRLFVHELKEVDTGEYCCVARNESWTDTTSVFVKVAGVPVIPRRHVRSPDLTNIHTVEQARVNASIVACQAPFFMEHPDSTVTVREGDDLVLTCRVGGDPKPRVNLYRACRDVSLQPRGFRETVGDCVRFILRSTVLVDAGRMTLEAKNFYGVERFIVQLKILKAEKRARSMTPGIFGSRSYTTGITEYNRRHCASGVPGKLSEPIASELGPSWVSLRWTRPESNSPILAYKIEAWDLSEGARWVTLGMSPIASFEAFHLRPRTEYLFRVTPRNRFGWGESVATKVPVCVRDKCEMPDFMQILPTRVKIFRGSTLSLSCEVRGSPNPILSWWRDGIEIPGESGKSIQVPVETDFQLTCKATNSVGHAASFCAVHAVNEKAIAEADLLLRSGGSTSPQFVMRLRDRKVHVGHPVRLTCQVEGTGQVNVKWEKDGLDLLDGAYSFQDKNFYTLELSSLKLGDTGIYTVRASNEFGEVSCSCSVSVCTDYGAIPRWIKSLRDYVKVNEGGTIVLEGHCQAWPNIAVKWFKDSNRLRSYNRRFRYELDTHGHISLVIQNCTSNDTGIYSVTVENEFGSIESICCVEVLPDDMDKLISSSSSSSLDKIPSAPRFVRKPVSTTVLEGDTVVIECSIEGCPKPEVTWLRDWLNPSYYKDADHYELESDGATEYRLVIPCVKIDYTGSYTVFAKNSLGSCKAIVVLGVNARIMEGTTSSIQVGRTLNLPKIIQPLTNMRCCDGDSVTLAFKAQGEDLSYIWDKDGKVISSAGNNPDFVVNGCQLTIRKVYGEDEGVYGCKIFNQLGEAKTKGCLIVDAPIADLTTTLAPSDEISNTIECSSTVRPSHFNFSPHPPPVLHFHRPPKFFVLPHNRIANQGDNIRFQCSVSDATVTTWEKDDQIISPSSHYSRKENEDIRVLEILNVTQRDAGIYRITLENHVGRVVANVRLDVIGRSRGGERLRAWSSSPVDNGRRAENWNERDECD